MGLPGESGGELEQMNNQDQLVAEPVAGDQVASRGNSKPGEHAGGHGVTRGSRLYLATWCLLAIFAIGYIATLTWPPGMISQSRLPGTKSQDSLAVTQAETLSRITAENKIALTELRRDMEQIRTDLNRMETDVSSLGDPAKVANVNVKSPEQQAAIAGQNAPKAASASADDTSATAASRAAKALVDSNQGNGNVVTTTNLVGVTIEAGQELAEPVSATEFLANGAGLTSGNNNQTSGIDTVADIVNAASQQAVVEVTPAVVQAPIAVPPRPLRKQLGVELARGPSVDSIRLSWTLLSEQHGALFEGLAVRYRTMNDPSTPYRLIAGPFVNEITAAQLCGRLKIQNLGCQLTVFSGQLL